MVPQCRRNSEVPDELVMCVLCHFGHILSSTKAPRCTAWPCYEWQCFCLHSLRPGLLEHLHVVKERGLMSATSSSTRQVLECGTDHVVQQVIDLVQE